MLAVVNTPSAPIPVELREVGEPEPAADEAIVEVHAFSVNRGELALLGIRPEGWRPGQDIAGVVVQAAADGSGPKEGTRVVALADGGGWAQRVAAPTARMAALPDNVSFASAATLPVAGLTALRTVRLGGALLGRRGAAAGLRLRRPPAARAGRRQVLRRQRVGRARAGAAPSPDRRRRRAPPRGGDLRLRPLRLGRRSVARGPGRGLLDAGGVESRPHSIRR